MVSTVGILHAFSISILHHFSISYFILLCIKKVFRMPCIVIFIFIYILFHIIFVVIFLKLNHRTKRKNIAVLENTKVIHPMFMMNLNTPLKNFFQRERQKENLF